MKRLGMKLGLLAALGLSSIAAPGAALAAGWRGGGGYHGGGYHGGGYRGGYAPHVAPAPVYRGAPAWGGHVRTYAPAYTRTWVPGYWGLHGGTRLWIGGSWAYPPYAGWFWVAPHWQWNGYQWVWQQGYWAPPSY